jgi:hypothetical protein
MFIDYHEWNDRIVLYTNVQIGRPSYVTHLWDYVTQHPTMDDPLETYYSSIQLWMDQNWITKVPRLGDKKSYKPSYFLDTPLLN